MPGASPEGSFNEEPKWYLKCLFTPACSILSKIYSTMWYDITETKPKTCAWNIFGKSILFEAPVYKIQVCWNWDDHLGNYPEVPETNCVGIILDSRTEQTPNFLPSCEAEPRPMAEQDAGSGQTTALSVCAFTGESDWKGLTRVVGTEWRTGVLLFHLAACCSTPLVRLWWLQSCTGCWVMGASAGP